MISPADTDSSQRSTSQSGASAGPAINGAPTTDLQSQGCGSMSTSVHELISPADAQSRIFDAIKALPTESVDLRLSLGRVLRQDVNADTDHPPFDRVMMDGIALRAIDAGADLEMIGVQLAGSSGGVHVAPGCCIEVATGAAVPQGCDVVVPYERIQKIGNHYRVIANHAVHSGDYIHRQASDCPAGSRLINSGGRIRGTDMLVLASNGFSTVTVAANPNVAIVCTGDELADVDALPTHGKVRRSNDSGLLGVLHSRGLINTAVSYVADDLERIEHAIFEALADSEVVIVTGGVSKGRCDLVPAALGRAGVRKVFHGVSQRPGKPLWFGTGPKGQLVFALPGNPVSAMVCAVRYVIPAVLHAQGHSRPPLRLAMARSSGEVRDITRYVPATLSSGLAGHVDMMPWSNSGDFTALIGTDGVVEIPAGETIREGQSVSFYRW